MATQNYFKAKNGLEAPSQSTIAVTDSNFPTVRPTLNLDFAGSKSVDSRITFTRASAATYTGADGKIKYAVQNEPRIDYDPVTGECKGLLIEEQRTNRLLYSSHLKVGDWTTDSGGKLYANDAIAPDGTLTAYRLVETSASQIQSRFIRTAAWTDLSSSQFTYSHYVKSYGQKRNVFMLCQQSQDAFYAHFDIVAGTVVQSSGNGTGVLIGAGIENKGNGWYRIWISGYVPNSSAIYSMIHLDAVGSTGFGATGYQGDGLSGVYVWGPQFEAGAFPTSYIPSTTTFTSRASSATYFDSTGVLRIAGANQARYGYGYDSTSGKWVSQGLLLESSSTNLYASGNGLLNALSGCTATPNSGYAPDGTYTANRYTASTNYVYTASQGSIIGGGATHTWSFYIKPVNNTIRFANGGTFGSFTYNLDFSTSTPTATFTATNATNNGYYFVNAGNGWWRFVCTVTASGTPGYMETQWAYTSGTTADFYLWGIQLEAGAAASSYIFTSGASVTRAGDVSASSSSTRADEWAKVDLSSFVTKEFTAYTEWNSMGYSNPYPRIFNFSTFLAAIYQASSNTYYVQNNFTPITTVYTPTTLSTNTWNKTTAAYSQTTDLFSAQSNGSTVYNSSAFGNLPLQKTYVYIGSEQGTSGRHLNAWFKGFKLYAKRLSDTQLQAITS